jgi:60 kDa SS-A/Ro ribonucleoprotein
VQDIADALDDAFYLAFDAVVPTGKRWLLGLDVSGSMTWGDIAGMPGITPNIAATAMAMVTARVEKQKAIMGFADSFRDLGISSKDSLKAALKKTQNMSFGGTDCALPMMYAAQNKIDVDTFVVYTDNETWAGRVQPVQALRQYRHKTGIPAKLIVVGMTATSFTIADPSDGGMMDVVGFDTAAPDIMADFAKGQLSK